MEEHEEEEEVQNDVEVRGTKEAQALLWASFAQKMLLATVSTAG